MSKPWFKWFRSIIHHPVFVNDPLAWRVFEALMCLSDDDGVWEGGLNQLAGSIKEDRNAVYSALKRLEEQTMCKRSANKRYTRYQILNYSIWQSDEQTRQQTGSKRSANDQQNSIKIREEKTNTVTNVTVASPRNVELDELMTFAHGLSFPLQGSQRANRYAASNLLKKYGVEPAKRLVEAAVKVRGESYAPTVSDFPTLYRRAGDLVTFVKRQQVAGGKHVTIPS